MIEADLLVEGADIVVFDDAGTEIRDGSIAIAGNSIAWLGPATEQRTGPRQGDDRWPAA